MHEIANTLIWECMAGSGNTSLDTGAFYKVFLTFNVKVVDTLVKVSPAHVELLKQFITGKKHRVHVEAFCNTFFEIYCGQRVRCNEGYVDFLYFVLVINDLVIYSRFCRI